MFFCLVVPNKKPIFVTTKQQSRKAPSGVNPGL